MTGLRGAERGPILIPTSREVPGDASRLETKMHNHPTTHPQIRLSPGLGNFVARRGPTDPTPDGSLIWGAGYSAVVRWAGAEYTVRPDDGIGPSFWESRDEAKRAAARAIDAAEHAQTGGEKGRPATGYLLVGRRGALSPRVARS